MALIQSNLHQRCEKKPREKPGLLTLKPSACSELSTLFPLRNGLVHLVKYYLDLVRGNEIARLRKSGAGLGTSGNLRFAFVTGKDSAALI